MEEQLWELWEEFREVEHDGRYSFEYDWYGHEYDCEVEHDDWYGLEDDCDDCACEKLEDDDTVTEWLGDIEEGFIGIGLFSLAALV